MLLPSPLVAPAIEVLGNNPRFRSLGRLGCPVLAADEPLMYNGLVRTREVPPVIDGSNLLLPVEAMRE